MHLAVQNLTNDALTINVQPARSKFSIQRKGAPSLQDLVLLPSLGAGASLPSARNVKVVLGHARPILDRLDSSFTSASTVDPKGADVKHFKLELAVPALGTSWKALEVPNESPWRVYARRVSRKRYNLVVLGHRSLGSFLSQLPGTLPLSSLSLPGTHDTMAFHGWPISQCQSPSTQLSTQLLGGIRVIDIRLAVIPPPRPGSDPTPTPDQELIAYHGLWPQKASFTGILQDIYNFLTSPIGSKETVVMSIKQEDFVITPAPLFSKLVHETIARSAGGWDQQSTVGVNKGMWFLENRIPTLGEVRGKVVMLSRFGGNGAGWEGGLEGLGIHPTTWPDSEKAGFEWELKGTTVRTHDWYGIPSFWSIPEKVKLASDNLLVSAGNVKPILPFSYFSAASFPLALPPVVAKGFGWPNWGLGVEGVNTRLGAWLLDRLGTSSNTESNLSESEKVESSNTIVEPRIRGWSMLDYYAEPGAGDIVPLLVECNFRGRQAGEEGWL
ncbi:hypothetical protein D9619_006057 [Psilocybe cf. subviscida]|uniref:Phosphatidylinositol-specific phospholipase C X domain-containing protein n=1 Tax=Psilocybe cf. subviscida TaxID=2480587 RepID=A0A8H5FBV8_9AGAR|nr:hypothetical protein D9619_006057 [Psilocybe cf. subviscida]